MKGAHVWQIVTKIGNVDAIGIASGIQVGIGIGTGIGGATSAATGITPATTIGIRADVTRVANAPAGTGIRTASAGRVDTAKPGTKIMGSSGAAAMRAGATAATRGRNAARITALAAIGDRRDDGARTAIAR